MSQMSLWIGSRTSVSLGEAVQAFAQLFSLAAGMPAIVYTPNKCCFALCRNGSFQGPWGEDIDLQRVYEARVFNASAELRWLNDPTPRANHRAVILTEEDLAQQLSAWQVRSQPIWGTLPQTYLLWGQGTGDHDDTWSRLFSARIGVLDVPVPKVPDNANVLLHSVEYLVEREHGNIVVFDERFVRLSIE